jgi:signal transduction histidine kinase
MLLEKLSVVGGLVRHDVRNKLSTINNSIYLAKKADDKTNLLKQLDQINTTTANIIRIFEFAETYESVGSKGLSWVPISKAIDYSQGLFTNLKGITVEVSDVAFEVRADSALVEIFHNLIDNSLKYGKNLTRIAIHTQKEENGDLQVFYEDDGGGIDPEMKQRLFQKNSGKGTGLGLYLIQRICDIYGWQIHEEGQAGKGVRFVLTIPQKLNRSL